VRRLRRTCIGGGDTPRRVEPPWLHVRRVWLLKQPGYPERVTAAALRRCDLAQPRDSPAKRSLNYAPR
ncbi:hypothetical protein, partial [Mycobacterium tuberculosis]